MATKNEEAKNTQDKPPKEERKCECGVHADFVDGLCRRCALSE